MAYIVSQTKDAFKEAAELTTSTGTYHMAYYCDTANTFVIMDTGYANEDEMFLAESRR